MKEKQNEITGCVIKDWGQIDADWKSAWICLLKIGRRLTKIAQTRPRNRYSYSSCRPPPTEPGELSSSEDEIDTRHTVKSKVVKPHNEPNPRTAKFNHLRQDPDFRQFLNEVLDERDNRVNHSTKRKRSDKKQKGENLTVDCEHVDHDQAHRKKSIHPMPMVKSPSDTTIYSPGLRKASKEDVSLIEKISNFVESIKLDGKNRVSRPVVDEGEPAKHGKGQNSQQQARLLPHRTPLVSLIRGLGDTRRVEQSACRLSRSRSDCAAAVKLIATRRTE